MIQKYTDVNNNTFYYKNHRLHRTDGPAIEWADGIKEYFIDGVKVAPFSDIDESNANNI